VTRYLLIFAFLFAGCATKSLRDQLKNANDVTVLATPHSGMLANPNYTVRDFAAAIQIFHPTVILTEVRPSHSGPIEGSLDSGIEQSLVYAMAKEVGATVIPVDWYSEASHGGADPWAPLTEEQRERALALRAAYSSRMNTASLLQLNGQSFQEKVRAYNEYVEVHGLTAGRERLDQICLNLRGQLSRQSKARVMVIFGSEQKDYLDHCVDSIPGQRLKAVSTWYQPSKAGQFKLSSAVKDRAVDSILGAQALLDQRLRANYYTGDMKARGVSKLVSLKGWMRAIERQ
jgi:hypothetical protein